MNCPHCIEFVKKNWNHALAAASKFRMHPVIFLSHSAKETGWGRSYLALTCNNYFGIMAAGETNPYWDGQYYQSSGGAKWRKYATVKDSFMDYGRLISTSGHYKTAYSVSADPDQYAKAISQSPYMTDADGRTKYYHDFLSINKTIIGIAAAEKLKTTMGFNVLGFAMIILMGGILFKKARNT